MSKMRTDQPGEMEVVDRHQTVTFRFGGRLIEAHPGDTIASALAASGQHTISRSFKYHRRRGILCCSGHCPNCLVQVGKEPNVRACQREVKPGLQVSPQNVWPTLDFDVLSMAGLGGIFMPVGFYYKTFLRPAWLWPLYEAVLRRIAGLGKVHPDTPEQHFDKEYRFADVVVVGGGPAGMSAALSAADKGAERVLLLESEPALGGHLRFDDDGQLKSLRARVEDTPAIEVLLRSTVLSIFEDRWLSAERGDRLYKIRAGSVLFCTGAYEQPKVFPNNDLPGILLGEAALRLQNLYGVRPGQRVVIATANSDGWRVARALVEAGVEVSAVIDERYSDTDHLAGPLMESGVTAVWADSIQRAEGSDRVRLVQTEGGQTFRCDTLVLSLGWRPNNGLLYQAGAEIDYNEHLGEFLPVGYPEGIYAAGRVRGAHSSVDSAKDGEIVGAQAAAFSLGKKAPRKRKQPEPAARTSTNISSQAEGKKFVCLCEDVTERDIEISIAEGYASMELLKRYSTVSMGPCQGAMCSLNCIHLCSRINDKAVAETGTTTSRPPSTPVKLGVLAGQKMEPVQRTPIHQWHVDRGATMMNTGLWVRPEHYGDPVAEVKNVRQGVGLIDLSTLGKFRVKGTGVPDFLERVLTNRWQNLAVGRVRYALFCNDEGIVINDGVVARVAEDDFMMTCTSTGSDGIYEYLQWWLQSGWGKNVCLQNTTEDFGALNLAGPQARSVLLKLTKDPIENDDFPYLHFRELTVGGIPCRAMRIGFVGELSYEIHCPASHTLNLWKALMQAGEEYGIRPFGVEAQRVLRLEKAHLIVGQDTDATSDPLSAGVGWAVKLDKDDFLGHRALKRIDEEGSRQKLVGFKMKDGKTVPSEGEQVIAHLGGRYHAVGWVTSARHSPTLGEPIGLAWVPEEVTDGFTIRVKKKPVEASIYKGAFYDPEGERLTC